MNCDLCFEDFSFDTTGYQIRTRFKAHALEINGETGERRSIDDFICCAKCLREFDKKRHEHYKLLNKKDDL